MEFRRVLVRSGGGARDVAQAGNSENEEALLRACVQETAEVDLADVAAAGEVVGKDADLLEQVAADVAPLVAAHAAEALEQVIAALLGRRDGLVAAAQVLVEACFGGEQRAVECGEGAEHVLPRDAVAVGPRQGGPAGAVGARTSGTERSWWRERMG